MSDSEPRRSVGRPPKVPTPEPGNQRGIAQFLVPARAQLGTQHPLATQLLTTTIVHDRAVAPAKMPLQPGALQPGALPSEAQVPLPPSLSQQQLHPVLHQSTPSLIDLSLPDIAVLQSASGQQLRQAQPHAPCLQPSRSNKPKSSWQDAHVQLFGTWAKEHISGLAQCMPCSCESRPCLIIPKSDNLRKHRDGQPVTAAEASAIRLHAKEEIFAAAGLDTDCLEVSSDESSDDDDQRIEQGAVRLMLAEATKLSLALGISRLKEAAAAAVLGGFKSEHQLKVERLAKFVQPSSNAAVTPPTLRFLWDADKVRSLQLKTVLNPGDSTQRIYVGEPPRQVFESGWYSRVRELTQVLRMIASDNCFSTLVGLLPLRSCTCTLVPVFRPC